MKILVSVTGFFPFGTPIASRMLNFCRLFMSLGYEVDVFCDYLSNDEYKVLPNKASFEKINIYYSFDRRILKSRLFSRIVTSTKISKFIESNSIGLIFSSSSTERFKSVLRLAKKNKIPLVLESCEKYHFSNWLLGKFSLGFWEFNRCWNYDFFKADYVVAISRLIENHFKEKGKRVVRIPSILDVENIPCKLTYDNSGSLKFIFSGGLGHGKDSLVEFMIAMNNVKEKLSRKIELNIYGPSRDAVKEQLGKNADVMQELGDMVHYHGRIPQNEIPQRLLENDFGIILRPQRESSNAGFPTKLAEYMAAGLPVLANDTGDIGLYLNNSNGLLLENKNVENVERAILAIDSLSNIELLNMRKAARETAENVFDYRLYKTDVKKLLMDVL